jgi:hypothetical protein
VGAHFNISPALSMSDVQSSANDAPSSESDVFSSENDVCSFEGDIHGLDVETHYSYCSSVTQESLRGWEAQIGTVRDSAKFKNKLMGVMIYF